MSSAIFLNHKLKTVELVYSIDSVLHFCFSGNPECKLSFQSSVQRASNHESDETYGRPDWNLLETCPERMRDGSREKFHVHVL